MNFYNYVYWWSLSIVWCAHAMHKDAPQPSVVHVIAVVDSLNMPLVSTAYCHKVVPLPGRDHVGCITPDFITMTPVLEVVSLVSEDDQLSSEHHFFWSENGLTLWVDRRGFWCSREEAGSLRADNPACWVSRHAFTENLCSGGTARCGIPAKVHVENLIGTLKRNTHYWVIVRGDEAILDPRVADDILRKIKRK